jgi:lysozyme
MHRLTKIALLNKVANVTHTEYTIKSGDSIDRIARGDPQLRKAILELNPSVDPSKLQIGQKIKIPSAIESPNSGLTPSNAIKVLIKTYEGKIISGKLYPHTKAFDDGYGNITIGWGRHISPSDSKTITAEQADVMFKEDIDKAASFIRRNISKKLTQGQFDALVSLVYNVGTGKFFKSKTYGLIESGNMRAAAELLPNAFVGNSDGLKKRRLKELEFFLR